MTPFEIIVIILFVLLIVQLQIGVGKNKEKQEIQKSNEPAGLSQKELEKFNEGMSHLWMLVKLSLFKLYKENTILDYDSQVDPIQHNIDFFMNNQSEIQKWAADLNKHVEGK